MRSQLKYLSAFLLLLLTIISIRLLVNLRYPEEEITFSTNAKSKYQLDYDERFGYNHFEPPQSSGDDATLPTGKTKIVTNEVKRVKNKQHLKEALLFPSRLAEFNFDACDMDSCFDFTLCNTSDIVKIHIVASDREKDKESGMIPGESNIIHKRILNIIRNSKHYEPNPEKACLFVSEDDTLDRDPLSASFRRSYINTFQPKYRFGMNFLIFNLYSGTWPDYKENDFSGLKVGAAILAKASNSLDHHRSKFDISIPLFSYSHPNTATDNSHSHNPSLERSSSNKTFLLTFKGKRYVIGSGSDIRNSLYHLSNQRDVILLTTCRHGKRWREVEDARCSEDETNYQLYDFNELMNQSTFCLTPRGRRLGSFRFLEALNSTCIPVVLGDGWVWPFDEIIDWETAAIQFPLSDIFLIPDTLRDFDSYRVKSMQENCRNLYRKYFASIEKIVMTTIEIIRQRLRK